MSLVKTGARGRSAVRLTAELVVVVALLLLAAASIRARTTWHEVEDGVLWAATPAGVVAREVAPSSPASRAGVRRGDVVEAVAGRPVDTPADILARLHAGAPGQALPYTLVRTGARAPELVTVHLAPVPAGSRGLYYLLASVGIFSLLVGASVRVRRPDNPATLRQLGVAHHKVGNVLVRPGRSEA